MVTTGNNTMPNNAFGNPTTTESQRLKVSECMLDSGMDSNIKQQYVSKKNQVQILFSTINCLKNLSEVTNTAERGRSMTVTTNFTCNVDEKTSLKSQEDTDLKDEARILIRSDENQVLFTKEPNQNLENENDGHISNIENGLAVPTTIPISSDQLLSVNVGSVDPNALGSTSSLDDNIGASRTYLHASSMLSTCTTEHTGISMENLGDAQHHNALDHPAARQRDSSGSIRAAVARRKQNMTHRTAAQKREANLAVVLISSVTMFLICHAPRIFANL